jgi:hypothetical protein
MKGGHVRETGRMEEPQNERSGPSKQKEEEEWTNERADGERDWLMPVPSDWEDWQQYVHVQCVRA